MSIIDDDGKLLGVVNVIDLLVGLLVLAVLVAGAVFLMTPSPEAGERYVTLDLGQQPDHVIDAIETGDLVTYEGTGDNLTITDIYVYQDDGESAIMIRALARGNVEFDEARDREVFEFLSEPLRPGRVLDVSTPEYDAEGEVIDVGGDGATFTTSTTEVVIQTSVDPGTVEEMAVGDTFAIGDRTLAEIVSLRAYPSNMTSTTAYVGLEIQTIEVRDRVRFGHQRVAVGSTLTFDADGYAFDGDVIRRGDATIETASIELLLETTVPVDVAEGIQVGDSFDIAGEPLVAVEEVTTYATGDPATTRVLLGVTADLRTVDGQTFFGDREVRVGSTIPLLTDAYDLETTVVRRGTMAERGDPTTVTVEAEKLNVAPSLADRLTVGLTEQTGDIQTATLQNVTSQSAQVVLESDDGDIHQRKHPRNKDLTLTFAFDVRETADGVVYFRGEQLRTGETVMLELGGVTPVAVTVLEIE